MIENAYRNNKGYKLNYRTVKKPITIGLLL